MEHRVVDLLQLKRPLIIIRMSALTLLITLITGAIATAASAPAASAPAASKPAAPKPALTCRQEIHAELIRELWSRTKLLTNKLPRNESITTGQRLLPKFCTKCSKNAVGWVEMKELIDVYQRSVFKRGEVKKLFPLHYDDLLYRLQQTLEECVTSPEPSKHLESIKAMERKIKKKKNKGALKAVGEFIFIIRWMDELAGNHIQ
ncbi:uncharacterized protein LOC133424590 [Cololabis saira]|uniref:uncharacterized protein LOC133424590 n=1 Tax=Cololabis saira TaxID=129043 RepID=UPI002AD3028F|nr:uncharacterized protein LOC133424590 [Cololabis saira]